VVALRVVLLRVVPSEASLPGVVPLEASLPEEVPSEASLPEVALGGTLEDPWVGQSPDAAEGACAPEEASYVGEVPYPCGVAGPCGVVARGVALAYRGEEGLEADRLGEEGARQVGPVLHFQVGEEDGA
jgi:hypothetical protein